LIVIGAKNGSVLVQQQEEDLKAFVKDVNAAMT
jgi:hypothetical protein